MQTKIVLIAVEVPDARKICESIQDEYFKDLYSLEKELSEKLGSHKSFFYNYVQIHDLKEFMDECNGQTLNMDNYFMSYVRIDLE